jgi:peptidyl-prolyl cis-trans isomerase A (cyclophilin A)
MTPFRRLVLVALLGLVPALAAFAAGPQRVRLATSQGDIVVELDAEKAPKTVANFLQYVKAGHYNGTVFHRVIDGFMIQGGGFTPDFQQKPTRAPIALETRPELKNQRGTLAMARTANPNSATAQFFINVVDNRNLDAPNPDGYGYAVFGKVVQGMDVVDKIKAVPTGNRGPFQNVPATPVVIQSATLVK